MKNYLELLLLSALWGGSFLFLRLISPVLGPVVLIELRVLIAFLALAPVLLYQQKWPELRRHWPMIALLALGNMCIPFILIAYATLSINAGMASILNATVPFFTALSAFLLWQQKLGPVAVGGMALGFAGVVVLVLGNGGDVYGFDSLTAVLAGLLASLLYGVSANIITRRLAGVSGLVITVGSLFFSSLFLAPFALVATVPQFPTFNTWISLIVLSIFCTALAYLLFYRLIARIGAYRTVTVTFLVPVFSLFWGWLILGEKLTPAMAAGCVLVLAGVALATGRLSSPWSRVSQ